MEIAMINHNILLNHHQFAKEFLAIMETDSTQKAVVHNVFAGKVEMILKTSLDLTLDWYYKVLKNKSNPLYITNKQIEMYMKKSKLK